MADIQSPIYEKGKTYKATYITSDGKEKETEFTPNKDINKVGVIRGLNKKAKDFFKLVKITENKIKEECKVKKITESAQGLMRMIWGKDASMDDMTEEEIANLKKLDNAIGECEDEENYFKIESVINEVGKKIGLTEEEIKSLVKQYDDIYHDEMYDDNMYDDELIEKDDYFEIAVVDGDTEGVVSLSRGNGDKWFEKVISGNLDKSKFYKTYQSYLSKPDILQWFKQDFDSATLNESKEIKTEAKSSISKLKKELEDAVKSFMTKPEIGFDESDVNDYSTVDVTWDKDNVIAEIRAELTYNSMMELSEVVDKIVSKYDKDAYFDNVDSGIIRAIIDNSNKNILEESNYDEENVKENDVAKLTGFGEDAETVNEFADYIEDRLAGKGYETFVDKLDDIINIGIKKDGKETLVALYSTSDNYGFEDLTVGIGGDFDVEPIYRKGWDAETATPKGNGVIGQPVYAMFTELTNTSVEEIVEIIDEAFAANDGLTESIDSVHTEYVITYDDMSIEDDYFEDKNEADAKFNELKRNGNINKVHQYYKKNWEFNEDTADYDEGDVEVYYTKGDDLEECKVPSKVEEGYLHLSFTDGSNPYVKYVDTIEEVDEEIAKWEKEYKVTVVKEDGSKIFATAEPKRKPSNLFDFDDEELNEK